MSKTLIMAAIIAHAAPVDWPHAKADILISEAQAPVFVFSTKDGQELRCGTVQTSQELTSLTEVDWWRVRAQGVRSALGVLEADVCVADTDDSALAALKQRK